MRHSHQNKLHYSNESEKQSNQNSNCRCDFKPNNHNYLGTQCIIHVITAWPHTNHNHYHEYHINLNYNQYHEPHTNLNLLFHSDKKQGDEVDDEYWPENRNVHEVEECASNSNHETFEGAVPEKGWNQRFSWEGMNGYYLFPPNQRFNSFRYTFALVDETTSWMTKYKKKTFWK